MYKTDIDAKLFRNFQEGVVFQSLSLETTVI